MRGGGGVRRASPTHGGMQRHPGRTMAQERVRGALTTSRTGRGDAFGPFWRAFQPRPALREECKRARARRLPYGERAPCGDGADKYTAWSGSACRVRARALSPRRCADGARMRFGAQFGPPAPLGETCTGSVVREEEVCTRIVHVYVCCVPYMPLRERAAAGDFFPARSGARPSVRVCARKRRGRRRRGGPCLRAGIASAACRPPRAGAGQGLSCIATGGVARGVHCAKARACERESARPTRGGGKRRAPLFRLSPHFQLAFPGALTMGAGRYARKGDTQT